MSVIQRATEVSSELVANCQTTRICTPEYHGAYIHPRKFLQTSPGRASYLRLCAVRLQWWVVGVVAFAVLDVHKTEENTYFEDLPINCSGLLIGEEGATCCFTLVMTSGVLHFPFFQYEHPILIVSVVLVLYHFISIRCWFLLYPCSPKTPSEIIELKWHSLKNIFFSGFWWSS